MFSKIKSLCKEFYKSRKLIASFVLAMMLAFSIFNSSVLILSAEESKSVYHYEFTEFFSGYKVDYEIDSDTPVYVISQKFNGKWINLSNNYCSFIRLSADGVTRETVTPNLVSVSFWDTSTSKYVEKSNVGIPTCLGTSTYFLPSDNSSCDKLYYLSAYFDGKNPNDYEAYLSDFYNQYLMNGSVSMPEGYTLVGR